MSKTVLITGASGGIGAALAKSFAVDGYNLVLQYNKNAKRAETLSVECAALGALVKTVQADITRPKDVENLQKETAAFFGGADIVINNAGVARIALLTDLTPEEIKEIIDINLTGALLVCRAFTPYMVNNGFGRIINISSMWGVSGGSCEVAYSASKAGIIGLTKALAKELAPSGITVNAVAPGLIDTEMNAKLSKETINSLIEETPVGRIGVPKDVVNAVRFFASDASSFITAETMSVTGGL